MLRVCNLFIQLDGTPSCEESYSYIEVAEDTDVGTVVKEIKCSLGTSNKGTLSYSLKDGNTHGKFGVNTINGIGQVYVHQAISFESRTIKFQLNIGISDNNPDPSTTNYILDVQVTGINDYAPLFLFSPYTVYVNEDRKPGNVISSPIPYDFDKGADGMTTSMIVDGDETLFYMDPNTAKVYLRSYLDYERQSDYVLTIQVTDNGLPERRSSTTLLNIHIKDVNDNPPVCEQSYITETIDETREPGSVIKFIKCSDADPGNNGRLTYTITNGDYTKFRLQGPYLILSKDIDVDKEANMWSITVMVRDRGSPRLSTVVDIIIYVEGVDDNVPVWAPPENGNYIVEIEEHSAVGKHIVRVSADDKDVDENNAKVAYYIDGYNSDFTIKPTTGDIFLNRELDREESSTYTLSVSAVSNNNPIDRITTNVVVNVIDINDNTPEFDKDVYQVSLLESMPSKSTITTITATDDDEGTNGRIQYIIVGGNPDSLFDVDTHSGSIMLLGNLDFESAPSHTVHLRASDRGRPTRWSTCTVIISVQPVNEFEPMFKEMDTVYIPEDTDIGMSVFTIEASDGDSGSDGEVTYTVQHPEDKFIVEAHTGIVRLLTALDRETLPEFKTTILAQDSSKTQKKSSSMTVNIKVVDNNDNQPICSKNFYSIQLSPPKSSGDVVLQLNCTDMDSAANSKLSYAIISGNMNTDFAISTDGNVVIMRKPSSSKYRLKIRVSDNGSPSFDTFVLIVITTGGQPSFENIPKTISVYENVEIGTSLFTLKAKSVSNQLEYSIMELKPKSDASSQIVKIDKIKGTIYSWNDFDRELNDRFTITVVAKDSVSGLEIEGNTDLVILDVNDNAPVFEKLVYNISIVENIALNSVVLVVKAEDADIDNNGEVEFAINDGNYDNALRINKNGELIVRSQIDREKIEAFALTVTANDKSTERRFTSTAEILITIIDIDEYAPEFVNMGSNLETELSEDTPIAAKVFAMVARDLDVNRKISYSIDSLSREHFIIDANTGDIFLTKYLDRETRNVHIIQVTATEHDKKVVAGITVRVLDVNDNDPTFDNNIYNFNVQEHTGIGTRIGELIVDDADADENGLVSVSITKGNHGNALIISENSLYVNGILDFESLNEYLLEIEARDGGTPQRTATAVVIIQVTPEYKIPMFAVREDMIHLPENSHVGYLVYDADATLSGAREGHGKDLMYSIENGNINGIFSINRETGEISIARRLDKKLDQSNFNIFLSARNIYNPHLSDMLALTVIVDDINDNAPTFEHKNYIFNVKEDAKLGTSIGLLTASDLDQGRNAFVTYELERNEDTDTFHIDEFIGTLSLKKSLNYLYKQDYQFYVLAYDHGSPSLTGTSYVQVKIMDINDKAPEFEGTESTIKVKENYPLNRNVHQVKATDGDSGVGGELLYKITKGNEAGMFELDSETGDITVAKQLDRESLDSLTLVLEAEDKGTPSLTGTMTLYILIVDVNDNVPYFTDNESEISLDRFAPVETHVLKVSALDKDEGSNALIEYQIFEEHDELFQIDSNTGHVYTFSDVSNVEDDISLTIVAMDHGYPRLTATVTILIELHPPLSVDKEDFSFTVSEYASPNNFIGSVASAVPSKYSIISGNYKKHFRITEENGNIFLNKILDREEYTDYFLRVESTNRRNPSVHKKLNIHIVVKDENDNTPVFEKSKYEMSVLEHTPVGFSIGSFKATDIDYGDNGNVTYLIGTNKEEAEQVFKVTDEGDLIVKSSISYAMFDHLNFNVIAKDNGEFSRQASAEVYVKIINIDETSVGSNLDSNTSDMINLEIPVNAYVGYTVGCLNPQMFGFNVSASKVYFVGQTDQNAFSVSTDTGCITLQKSLESSSNEQHFLIWTVAILKYSSEKHGRLALVRVDTFFPNKHVVILTHSVSKEVLELNRSKSYVYVIRNNDTHSVGGVMSKKEFIFQADILNILEDKYGGVSHDLTSEDFDNFPVVSIDSYNKLETPKLPWLLSPTGYVVIAVIVLLIIGCFILCLIICLKKKKKNSIKTANKMFDRKPSLFVSPNCNKTDFKFNNLRRSSSTADIAPLMNALKILSDMSETQRSSVIEHAMKSTRKDNPPEKENFRSRFLTRMKTLPIINITNVDEVNPPRKISNEKVEEKMKSKGDETIVQRTTIVSSPIAPFITTADVSASRDTNESEDKTQEISTPTIVQTTNVETFIEPRSTRLSSVPDDGSISSLELDATETLEVKEPAEPEIETKEVINLESEVKSKEVTNGPIVIGGKEYDGVGKDTTSGGKYLYNTTTGDKLHVTDDILKRAIEQRQSVVTNEFKDRQGVKVSTFKKPPMRRKQSRTRFSTTTIWEMNVDLDNPHIDHENMEGKSVEDRENDVFEDDAQEPKRRRQGVDYSNEAIRGNLSTEVDNVERHGSLASDTSEIDSDQVSPACHTTVNTDEEANVKNDNKASGLKSAVKANVVRKYDNKDDVLKRRISANQNWEKVLIDTNVIDGDKPKLRPTLNNGSSTAQPSSTSGESEPVDEESENWSKAQKIVKFVRPVYKPLNLDSVTCKVPKGKSDPKDCLSKDPVYSGWAKMVGKRHKTKHLKKKDGTAKVVTIREGRSLPGNVEIPKDVISYTKLVSNQLPPHQRRQSVAIFNNNTETK
ncbi:Protocadherin Fat 4 [Mactra antiquata]